MAVVPNPDNIEDLSPYDLLLNFSRSRVLPAILLALVAHVVVVGGLSTSYIYRTWINPSAALTETEESTTDGDAKKDDTTETSATDEAASTEGKQPSTKSADDPTEGGDDKVPPVVKRTTEAAKPGDIPDQPIESGISIDEFNN